MQAKRKRDRTFSVRSLMSLIRMVCRRLTLLYKGQCPAQRSIESLGQHLPSDSLQASPPTMKRSCKRQSPNPDESRQFNEESEIPADNCRRIEGSSRPGRAFSKPTGMCGLLRLHHDRGLDQERTRHMLHALCGLHPKSR
jgi:hypothetical protein